MKEQLLSVIENYICDLELSSQYGPMFNSTFQQSSYIKWAAVEFYDYVRSQPEDLVPLAVAESFRDKMAVYERKHIDSVMFSIAVETMEDVVDLIICEFEEE